MPAGGGYTRSVAVRKFTYTPDGANPKMSMTNSPVQVGTVKPRKLA